MFPLVCNTTFIPCSNSNCYPKFTNDNFYLKEPVLYNNEKSFKQENLEKMEAAYEFVEKFLTSDWLAGDQVTLADICCVSTISSMNVIVPIDKKK